MVIEYEILERFSPFLLGYCNCGCNKQLKTLINRNKIITHFVPGHWAKKADLKGFNNSNYVNGRTNHGGYIKITMPDYYKADDCGKVREHVYNFEQYNKCCMLPWGDVHHIDGNRLNNMPWNLQGMMHNRHTQISHLNRNGNASDRRCFRCKTDKTNIGKPRVIGYTPSPRWCHLPFDKENWYCMNCYGVLMKKHKNSPVS